MKTNKSFWVLFAFIFLITMTQGCSDMELATHGSLSVAKKAEGELSLLSEENACEGIHEGVAWTAVNQSIRQPSVCADGSKIEDEYEHIMVLICSGGQVHRIDGRLGRLLESGECERGQDKCDSYEEGQVREKFRYKKGTLSCPGGDDSKGRIEITYLIRGAETCQGGSWVSEEEGGTSLRTVHQIDDSQCEVRPPQGKSCGDYRHNESWKETGTEKRYDACNEDETGAVELSRNIEHSYICLNGTVSRTSYIIGEWSETNRMCHKNCVKAGLEHGKFKVRTGTNTKNENCGEGFGGLVTKERTYTETLLCTNGEVSSSFSYGNWNLKERTCKRHCKNGRKHGQIWRSAKQKAKEMACQAGYVGQRQYRRRIEYNYQCLDGKIVEKMAAGNWLEISNTCRQTCADGHMEGDLWRKSEEETRTVQCASGYEGTIEQVRTKTNTFLCTRGSTHNKNIHLGQWRDQKRSCIRLCPSGHREGERWIRSDTRTSQLKCQRNFVGFIQRVYEDEISYVCKGGKDVKVKTTVVKQTDTNRCEPFTVRGRCWGERIYKSQVRDRRLWVSKCQNHSAINFFYRHLGGEKRYTHNGHYPTFGFTSGGRVTQAWRAPVSPSSPCNIPQGVRMVGICNAGFFTQDQKILFGDNSYIGIRAAYEEADVDQVMTVSPESFFEDIQLIGEKIGDFVVDILPAQQKIIEFRTASGGSLQVTEGHPMLTAEGRLVEALKLRQGDSLVLYNGKADRIVERRDFKIYDRVYNLYPVSRDLVQNLIVAEGFLTGSAFYQSEDNEHMGRIILRHALVADIFPEEN